MKVLWVSNSPIGPAANIWGNNYCGSSGGWIQTEYDCLDKDNIDMFFLCTLPSIKEFEVIKKTNNIGTAYFVHAPRISSGIAVYRRKQLLIQKIIDEVEPDIIHIWGTETWLSNSVAKVSTNAKKIIFIQGLIGVHQRYLGGYFKNNVRNREFASSLSLMSVVKNCIRNRGFRKQADIEINTIDLCRNVIIDSQFAQAYCESISENVCCYKHFLKPNNVFYQSEWSYDECEKKSIFTIYGSNSEKGTHNLLYAIAILKKRIPDIKVYIPGIYNLDNNRNLVKTHNNPYQNLLFDIIQSFSLQNNVVFTGKLNPSQMAEMMKKCNIFVNTSCMEVHALSLREAMVIGMPCITSQCGSVSEYVINGENGLIYRYEEYETLAYLICKLLYNVTIAENISREAKKAFRIVNHTDLSINEIYEELLKK